MATLTETKLKQNSDSSPLACGSLFRKTNQQKQNLSISISQKADHDKSLIKQGQTVFKTDYQFQAKKCPPKEQGITKCQPVIIKENKGGKTTRALKTKRPKNKELEDIENKKNFDHGYEWKIPSTKEKQEEINQRGSHSTRQAFNEVNGNFGMHVQTDNNSNDFTKRQKEIQQSIGLSTIQESSVPYTRQQVLEQTLKTLEICAQTERSQFSSQFNSKPQQLKRPVSSLTDTYIHRRGKSKDATVLQPMESQNKDIPVSKPTNNGFHHPKVKDYYRSSSTLDMRISVKNQCQEDRLNEIKEVKTPQGITTSVSRSLTPISKSIKNNIKTIIPAKVKKPKAIQSTITINQPFIASKVGITKTQKSKKITKQTQTSQPISQCTTQKTLIEEKSTHISKVEQLKGEKYESLPKQMIDKKPDQKITDKAMTIKIFKERILAVIKGYKVRRILKNNRQLYQLKQELIDLNKFVQILINEVNDSAQNHSRSSQTQSLQQTRQLLARTTKDLFSKRLLFYQAFNEAFYNPAWIKLSRKVAKTAINSNIYRYNTERRSEILPKQFEQHFQSKKNVLPQTQLRSSKNQIVARRGSASNLCENTVSGRNASMKALVNLNSTQQVQTESKLSEIQEDALLPSVSDLAIQRVQERVIENKHTCEYLPKTLQQSIAVQDSKIQEARKARKKLRSSRELRRSVDYRSKANIDRTIDQLDKSQTISTNEPLLIDLSIPIEVPFKEENGVHRKCIKMQKPQDLSFKHDPQASNILHEQEQIIRQSNASVCPTINQQILLNFQQDLDRSRVSQEFPIVNTTNLTIEACQYPILDTSQNISNLRNSTNQLNMLTSRTNSSANQMEQIIEDLKHTASSIESSQKQIKTMETLNAIRGMIESLKNNNILSPIEEVEKPERSNICGGVKHRRERSAELQRLKNNPNNLNQQKAKVLNELDLKKKFEALVTNLQSEFNNLLESRQQIANVETSKSFQRSKSTAKLGKKT